MEHLSFHLSHQNRLKRPNKEIGSVCFYASLWVRDHLLYVDIVNIRLIHRTVDLKYVLSTQVVQIQYEGRMHVFSVSAVSTRTEDISESFRALSMNDAARLYIVDWDTIVAIGDNVQPEVPESKSLNVEDLIPSSFALSNNVHQLDVGVSDEPQGTDAYTAVGGLDDQIAQIRDLIEIPFLRPELFRHFREPKSQSLLRLLNPNLPPYRPQAPSRVAPPWPSWDGKDSPCTSNLRLDGLVSHHSQRT